LAATTKPRTIVYIDGFNLYYGAVKDTPWKWLDLAKLFHMIRPADDIHCGRYFPAMVNGPTKPNQEIYLQALATKAPSK
jgi:6-hydroxy-3-succinoylpyridine 3-monooxygenase